MRIIKKIWHKYSKYRRDFYNLVVSIFIFHECDCGMKELQIIYLNDKICSPCTFLWRFYKASINFFEKRAHSKTPAEKRTDGTLSDKTLPDKSHESGGDEKFCPTIILSYKVVRKLGQIHILWLCILYLFLLFFGNKTFKNP